MGPEKTDQWQIDSEVHSAVTGEIDTNTPVEEDITQKIDTKNLNPTLEEFERHKTTADWIAFVKQHGLGEIPEDIEQTVMSDNYDTEISLSEFIKKLEQTHRKEKISLDIINLSGKLQEIDSEFKK